LLCWRETETPSTTLAQRLRLARLVRGFTRLQLAVRAEVAISTVHRLEGGMTHHPQPETLERLASVLGVTVAWLVSDDPDAPGGP
jgi:transcriptional regulator with XRE-family HTH domain